MAGVGCLGSVGAGGVVAKGPIPQGVQQQRTNVFLRSGIVVWPTISPEKNKKNKLNQGSMLFQPRIGARADDGADIK